MKTVRQQIVDHLHARGKVSALELSHALRVTPANVRHHLSILLKEGAIQVVGTLPSHGRGRPAQLYALTRKVYEHNLDSLASALMSEVFGSLPELEHDRIIKNIAARLNTAQSQKHPSANLTQRLNQAVQLLNEQHYAARWEAHAEAPRIILGNCPYRAILSDHPELCQLDTAFLGDLLATPAWQTAKLAKDSRGSTFCRFIIKKSDIRP